MNRLVTAWLLLPVLGACGEQYSLAAQKSTTLETRPHAACSAGSDLSATARAARGPEADAALVLPIAARSQAPESPASGWCGETAIQEGLLHAGAWTPQRLINRAGRPAHPDLYSSEIPRALERLGVRYAFYSPRSRSYDAFAAWMRAALEAGEPVFAGVKILPTQHPEWGLDHFVLVVGHGPKGFLVNTTWGHRAWVSDTTTPGLSFRNVSYGIRLQGLAHPSDRQPARLSVIDEGPATVKLRIACEGLTAGASYRIERRRSASDKEPLWSETATASGSRVEKELTVEADQPARFCCVLLPGQPASAAASAAPIAATPAYDLVADVARRIDEAKRELGPSSGATVVQDVFVVAAPSAGTARALARSVVKTALDAYFNGRFSRKPARAVSVYLFPSAAPYDAYCRRRWSSACISIYGFYLGEERKIVMNVGPGVGTLTHELVHPIIETDFPDAPEWLNEGIASLYEGFALPKPGEIRGVKNWRYAGLMAALNSPKRRDLVRLPRLFGMSDEVFRGQDEGLNYALARYVCLWLEQRNLLWSFYHGWRDNAASDRTGEEAFKKVVGMTPEEAAPRWERWVRRL
ncbi:MAG: hypothetical protein JW940_26390 [Polyangiaceae bacterium]|nr:hypothetical protein [Polyangiaceae bacterium]